MTPLTTTTQERRANENTSQALDKNTEDTHTQWKNDHSTCTPTTKDKTALYDFIPVWSRNIIIALALAETFVQTLFCGVKAMLYCYMFLYFVNTAGASHRPTANHNSCYPWTKGCLKTLLMLLMHLPNMTCFLWIVNLYICKALICREDCIIQCDWWFNTAASSDLNGLLLSRITWNMQQV